MPDSPSEGRHQEAEHAPSGRESGPQQRDSNLGPKSPGDGRPSGDAKSSGDRNPSAASGGTKGGEAERQARTDRPAPGGAKGDAGPGRPNGRDAQLSQGPRGREEQNTKADLNPAPKSADAPPSGPGRADKYKGGPASDGLARGVGGQDSPLRVAGEKLERAGQVVASKAQELRDWDKKTYDAAAGKVASVVDPVATVAQQTAENPKAAVEGIVEGSANVAWQSTPGAGIAQDVKDLKQAIASPATIGEIAEKRARALDGAVVGGSAREAAITFIQEKSKGSTTADAALAAADEGMKHVPFGGSAEKLDQTLTAFDRGDIKGGFKGAAELVGGFTKEVRDTTLMVDGARTEAVKPGGSPAPEAPKPEGPKAEGPKPVDPLGKTQEAPQAVDPLGKTQEARTAVEAGAADGPIHAQVRGGPEIGPGGAVTEVTSAAPKTTDGAGASQAPAGPNAEAGPPTVAGSGTDAPSAMPGERPAPSDSAPPTERDPAAAPTERTPAGTPTEGNAADPPTERNGAPTTAEAPKAADPAKTPQEMRAEVDSKIANVQERIAAVEAREAESGQTAATVQERAELRSEGNALLREKLALGRYAWTLPAGGSGAPKTSGQRPETTSPTGEQTKVATPTDVAKTSPATPNEGLGPNGRDRPQLNEGGDPRGGSAEPSGASIAGIASEMSEYIRGLDEVTRQATLKNVGDNKTDAEIGRRNASNRPDGGGPAADAKPERGEGLAPR